MDDIASGQGPRQGKVTFTKRLRHAHNFDHHPEGFYVEPHWVSERLFEVEEFGAAGATVLDPACGWCRIPMAAAAAGYSAHASDVVDRRGFIPFTHSPFNIRNFLTDMPTVRPWSIVTNPPFHLFREFAERAVEVAIYKAALFVPVRRLPAARWLQRLPLETVYLLSPRPSVPTGDFIAEGGKVTGGQNDFCWLVFNNKQTITAPRVRWLHRDPGKS